MSRKFIADISANTFQVVINQCCGLGIFYVLSTSLTKPDFGEINWSLAIMLTLFGILACGVDQVSIRRVASGADPKKVLSVYVSHVAVWGSLLYLAMLICRFIKPDFFSTHYFLLLFAIAKLMIFFSTPFKQLATGLEQFRALLFMATCSNIVRSVALVLFSLLGKLTLNTVIIIFIAGDLLEFITCIMITRYWLKVPLILRWNRKDYIDLLHESMPQLGVAIFTSILSRFDWIFLGLMGTIVVAEYSFAYKVFEMATLPMLVIAPVLIPRFTRMFSNQREVAVSEKDKLLKLLRIEMLIAALTALAMNILWVPVIDPLTGGKYGAVNRDTIMILSASLSFVYLNNYLWTINFARGRLKMIFYNFGFTVAINVIADCILIPAFKAEGAAAGYIIAIVGQSAFYLFNTKLEGIQRAALLAILCPLLAYLSWFWGNPTA